MAKRPSNHYFQFKQFTIQQDQCAMKVCTDSCVFGALLPSINFKNEPIQSVLEIGTGTGLLSLQYAQLNPQATITTIEVEEKAFLQAKQNIHESIFHQQIQCVHADFNEWPHNEKFDFIFCNPPFYENDLPSDKDLKNIAHHSTELTIETILTKVSSSFLTDEGVMAILIPSNRYEAINKMIELAHLHINLEVDLFQTELHTTPFRKILILSYQKEPVHKEKLIIKEDGVYSAAFIKLLKPFYLYL